MILRGKDTKSDASNESNVPVKEVREFQREEMSAAEVWTCGSLREVK